MQQRQAGWLLAAGVIVLWVAFGLRVWELGTESIWHDEGWSIRAIQSPFDTPDDNTPYIYYATLHLLWQAGIGDTAFAFRFGSVLIGLLTVALAVRVGGRWFGTPAGIAFGLLVATSPLLWEYAQEVRAYVAVPLFGLLMLALAERILRRQPDDAIQWRLWGAIFVVELVGLYTHNLVVALVAWLSVALGVVWLLRQDWRRIVAWGALHVGLLLAYVPWLLTQSPSGTALNTAPEPGFALLQDIWYSYFLPVLPQVQATDNSMLLNLAALLTFIAAAVFVLRKPRTQAWVLTSHVVIVPLFSTVILIAASIDFHPRYFIAAVPGTLLLLVGGVQSLSEILPAGRLLALSGVVLLGAVISQQSLSEIHNTRAYQHDDFAGVAAYYATLPPDAVILLPFDEEPALQNYFAQQYDIQAEFVNIPLYSDDATAIERIGALVQDTPRHVEFLTWFQLPADVRGMYPCLLGGSSVEVGETRTFFGLSTQRFMLATTPNPQSIAPRLAYPLATLQTLDYMSHQGGVCLRSEWEAHQNVDNLQVAMRIDSPNAGWQLTEHNTTLRNAEQVADLAPGEHATAYHFMQLPPGAPEQPYPVSMTLYDAQQPQGYDVVLNNEIVGKSYYPPEPIIAQGPLFITVPSATRLIADTVNSASIESGQQLQAEIVLAGAANRVTLQGEGWQRVHLEIRDHDRQAQRVWINFTIPPDASGQAALIAGDVVLKTYTINTIERTFTAPRLANTTDVTFGDFATLVGYTVNNPLDITLHWQAEDNSGTAYTVFVQLLAPDGRVIAQSDRQPANGQRPTTGWLPGEYIADNHLLTLNVNTYEGPVSVIVGFYDAQSFARVLTNVGQDAFRLAPDLVID
jgi:hypothetical protein